MFQLDKIILSYYNSDNIEHINAKKELVQGESFSKYIKQIEEKLVNNNNKYFSLNNAYLVYLNNIIVGYLFISNIKKYKVYIEYNILKEYRGKHIGKLLLSEITEYLLKNYNIREIVLDIDVSNLPSINLAESCEYYIEDEYNKNTATNSKIFTYVNSYFNIKKK